MKEMESIKSEKDVKFVFFGNSKYSLIVLETLCESGFRPITVVTKENSLVDDWATRNGVPTIEAVEIDSAQSLKKLESARADLFIVAGFSKLPKAVYEIPKHKTLNLHPSLLPLYRGAYPTETQLLNQEENLGVTIHVIDDEYDHGPIVSWKRLESPADSFIYPRFLGAQLALLGGQHLAQIVPDWVQGKIFAKEQNEKVATYAADVLKEKSKPLNEISSSLEKYRHYSILKHVGGAYFEVKNSKQERELFKVEEGYYRFDEFIVAKVYSEKSEVSMSYDDFLMKYGLDSIHDYKRNSFETNSETDRKPHLDVKDNISTLLEGSYKYAVKKSPDDKITSSFGGQLENGWLLDFRSLFLKPYYLKKIAEVFWDKYGDSYPFQVGGQETAAIPLITAIAMEGEKIGKPVNAFFLRKSRKKIGLQKHVEGSLTEEPIILVDDLVNSGSTQLRQIELLEKLGRKVTNVFVMVQYRTREAYQAITNKGIQIDNLFYPEDLGLQNTGQDYQPVYKPGFEAKWKFEADNPNLFYVVPKSSPTLSDNSLFFGTDNGTFWSLKQSDGSVNWKFHIKRKAGGKAIFSSPTLFKDLVYFGAYDGHVYALNSQSGEKKWDFKEADWVGSSPIIAPGLKSLFVGLEYGLFTKRGALVSLDTSTGEKKWEYRMPGLTHSTPAYSEKHKVVSVGCNDYVFRVFNAKTGDLLWEYKTGAEIRASAVYDEAKGLVIFGSHDDYIYACDIKTGKLKYSFKTDDAVYSTPCIHQDCLLVTSTDKRIYCLDMQTFKEKWRFETRGRIFCNPKVINDKIYTGSNDGFLYELDMNGKLLSVFPAGERIVNNVVYNSVTEKYFLPTHSNEIFCLTKK